MRIEIILTFVDYCDDCPLFDGDMKQCRLPGKWWVPEWADQAYPKNFIRPQECKDENDKVETD